MLPRTSRGPLGKWTKCEQCAGPQFVLFLGEEADLVDPSNTRTTPEPLQTASLTR